MERKNLFRTAFWWLMLMCVGSSQLWAMESAQEIEISRSLCSIRMIFEEVEKQTGMITLYSNDELDVNRRCTMKKGRYSISDLYDSLLDGTDLTYRVEKEYIVIRRGMAEKAVPENVRPFKVRGKVVDRQGESLPGVTVLIKGTQRGVSTDENGGFVIEIPGPDGVLQISYVGKKQLEVEVKGRNYLHLVMEDEEKMLKEVVCTGIQTISKERSTGSFEVIGEEALGRTLTPNIVSRLQGKIAGVQVDQNNNLLIRGRGSIYSNTEPLIVVDGFPLEGNLSSVNPDDIASITVLKDAAAASIWGVRAANGVVVITTKSAHVNEKVSLDVSYSLTVNSRPDMGDLHLMDSREIIDLQLEQIQKGLWDIYYMTIPYPGSNLLKEAYYATSRNIGSQSFDDIVADPAFMKRRAELEKMDFAGQYERELLRRAVSNRVNIALKGGTQKSDYYISGVYNHQELANVGDSDDDIMINLRHNYKLSDRLTFSTAMNVQYRKFENNGIGLDQALGEMPFNNLLDGKGNRIRYYAMPEYICKEKEAEGYMPYHRNLLEDQELNDKVTNDFSARLHAALKLEILEGLDIETRFQYERNYSKMEQTDVMAKSSVRNLINDLTLKNDDGSLNHQLPLGDVYSESRKDNDAWTWRNQLTYNKAWNDEEHQLTALLGHEMRKYATKMHNQKLYGYDRTALTYAPVDENTWYNGLYEGWSPYTGYDNRLFNSFHETDNRDLSIYMNAAYSLREKYTLTVSGRVDQSNLFGNDSDYKYNFIWSAGAGWRMDKEEFLRKDWLDQLVLRFTYGIGGNVNKDFYPVLMGQKKIMAGTGKPMIQLTNPANEDLTWEKSTTVNLGLDFALWNHRLSGNFDYYHRKSTDLLGTVALDPTNGFASATMNFASVLNQGFEMTLNGSPIQRAGWDWNLGFNISYNKNKVTKIEVPGNVDKDYLLPAPAAGEGVVVKGKPLGRLYAYPYAGLNEEGEVMLREGDREVHFLDYQNKTENLVYMGTDEAPWFGGLSTDISYKGFTLSANATFKFGHKFRLPTGSPSNTTGWITDDVSRRWRKPGDEKFTCVPAMTGDWNKVSLLEQYYNWADVNVRDAAWLRLNEISLSYNLPADLLGKCFVRNLEFQLQARNVCLWTANDEHVDPEAVNGSGSIYFGGTYSMPQPRSFILGIKATF